MGGSYPHKKLNFSICIGEKTVGEFSEVSASAVAEEPIERREGSFSGHGKQSDLIRYGNVTLRWGRSVTNDLQRWRQGIERGEIDRKTVVIRLLDDTGTEAARWSLTNAFPTKLVWCGDDSAIEYLELVQEGMVREK